MAYDHIYDGDTGTDWLIFHQYAEVVVPTQRPETVCERWRASLMQHYGGSPGPEHFLPQCDASGEFTPVQCYGETSYCWCVDKDGREVPGTRSHDRVKPACKCWIFNRSQLYWYMLFFVFLSFFFLTILFHCLHRFIISDCQENLYEGHVLFRYTNGASAHRTSIAPPRCDSSAFRHYSAVRSRPTDWSASSQRHAHG